MKEEIKKIKKQIIERRRLGVNNCKINYLPILSRNKIIDSLSKEYNIINLYNGSIVITW